MCDTELHTYNAEPVERAHWVLLLLLKRVEALQDLHAQRVAHEADQLTEEQSRALLTVLQVSRTRPGRVCQVVEQHEQVVENIFDDFVAGVVDGVW